MVNIHPKNFDIYAQRWKNKFVELPNKMNRTLICYQQSPSQLPKMWLDFYDYMLNPMKKLYTYRVSPKNINKVLQNHEKRANMYEIWFSLFFSVLLASRHYIFFKYLLILIVHGRFFFIFQFKNFSLFGPLYSIFMQDYPM